MANRPRPSSLTRKAVSLARQAWPARLALLVAAGIFSLLSRPVITRHRALHHAATVLPDGLWGERTRAVV